MAETASRAGPCLVWRDGEPTIKAAAGAVYGRL